MRKNSALTDEVNQKINRLLYCYTDREVAKLLGVTRATIYNWRTGKRNIGKVRYRAALDIFEKIAEEEEEEEEVEAEERKTV